MHLYLQGHRGPLHWDSPSIVDNMYNASQQFPGTAAAAGTYMFMRSVKNQAFTADQVPAVQKKIMPYISASVHPDTLLQLVVVRLRSLFPDDADEITGNIVAQVFSIMKNLPCHIAMVVMKTYCNAWSTSSRYQEAHRHGCIFGCRDTVDHLRHYFKCPRLWRVISATCSGAHTAQGPLAHLERLGLRPAVRVVPGRSSTPAACMHTFIDLDIVCRRICVAFSVYHAVKISNTENIIVLSTCQDYTNIVKTWRAHATIAARLYECRHIS